jgi:glycosyltransferase involved in cell wall biosynthesis
LLTAGMSDFTGGCKMSYLFAKALMAAGYGVHAVVGPRPPEPLPSMIEPLRLAGATVEERPGFNRLLDLRLIVDLARLIRERQIDGVVTSQVMDAKVAAWAARAAGVPCIIHAQAMVGFKGRALARQAKWWGYRGTLAATRPTVVCVSEPLRRQYNEQLRVPGDRLHVVENGVDVSRYAAVDAEARLRIRNELGIRETDLVLVNVGRLEELKGQDRLLAALAVARLPETVRVMLVGDESVDNQAASHRYITELHRLVAEHGLESKVIFTGWRDDIPELLGASDGYVLSSRWEGFPLVLLEAMAASLPVVSMDCVPTPRGFEHGTHGYLVCGGEADALARGLEWLTGLSAAERRQIGARGFELVHRDYDASVCAQRFVDIVEHALRADGSPASEPQQSDSPASASVLEPGDDSGLPESAGPDVIRGFVSRP